MSRMEPSDRQLLLMVNEKLDSVMALIERWKPLIERYEAAAKANSILKARKVLRDNA